MNSTLQLSTIKRPIYWIALPALIWSSLILTLIPSTLNSVQNISMASIEWVVVLALFAISLIFKESHPRFSLIPLILLIFPIISTLLNLSNLGSTWQGGLVNLLGSLLLYIALKPQLTAVSLHQTLRLLVLLSIPVALMAAAQYVTGALPILDNLNQHDFKTPQLAGRLSGTLGHPILLGTYSGFITLLLLLLPSLRFLPVSRALLIGLNFATLWASGSRSSIIPIALLSMLLLIRWLFMQFRKKKITALNLVVIWSLLLGVWLIIASGVGLDVSRFQDLQNSNSYLYRTQQWAGGWAQLIQSPLSLALGNGLGSTVTLFSQMRFTYLWGPATFDNAYVTLLYEVGFLGLIMLLLPLLIIIKRGGVGMFCVGFLLLNTFFFDSFRWPIFGLLLVLSLLMNQVKR